MLPVVVNRRGCCASRPASGCGISPRSTARRHRTSDRRRAGCRRRARSLSLCASATPSEMPICVEVPSSTPGMAVGLVEVPQLAHPCLRSLAVSTQSSFLIDLPDFHARAARSVIGEASQFLRASSCHLRPDLVVALADRGLRSAMRAARLGVAGDALAADAGQFGDAERGVAERAHRARLHAAIVHRPFADADLGEADLDEIAFAGGG